MKINTSNLDIKKIMRLGILLLVIILMFCYRAYLNGDSKTKKEITEEGITLKEISTTDSLIQELYSMIKVDNLTVHPNDYYYNNEITKDNITNALVSYILINNINWDLDNNIVCDTNQALTTLTKEDISEKLNILFGSESINEVSNNLYVGYNNEYTKLFNIMYSKDSDNYVVTCTTSLGENQKLTTDLKEAFISNDGSEVRIIENYEIKSYTNIEDNSKGNVTFNFRRGKDNKYFLYKVNRSKE